MNFLEARKLYFASALTRPKLFSSSIKVRSESCSFDTTFHLYYVKDTTLNGELPDISPLADITVCNGTLESSSLRGLTHTTTRILGDVSFTLQTCLKADELTLKRVLDSFDRLSEEFVIPSLVLQEIVVRYRSTRLLSIYRAARQASCQPSVRRLKKRCRERCRCQTTVSK